MANNKCLRCMKNSEEVKLLDALKDSRPVMICEPCSRIEEVIIIRRPTSKQLSSPNKHRSVYQRLQRMAGLEEKRDAEREQIPNVYELMNRKQELREKMMSDYSIKKRKEIERKLNRPTNLKEHYHWITQRERRKKGLTTKRFAEMIGEPETAIRMFEEGKLTDDSRRIAEKVEQLLKIRLLKTVEETEIDEETKRMEEARKQARIRAGIELPEEMKDKKEPARLLSFNPETLRNITLADLAEMKKRNNQEDNNQVMNIEQNNEMHINNQETEEPWEYKGQVIFYEI